MRLILILIILSSMACAKSGPESQVSEKLAPSSCIFDSTVSNHDFLNWPSADADKYTCPLYAKMTCEYFESDAGERELRCVGNNPADPNNAPSNCSFVQNGMHDFEDGMTRQANAYRCSSFAGVGCWYYRATTGHEEMLCYRQ